MKFTVGDFEKQLRDQLGFIRKSCAEYDGGSTREGVRVATSIRILFHSTEKSTSLMKHLRQEHLKMLSTCWQPPRLPDWLPSVQFELISPNLVMMQGSAGGTRFVPRLAQGERNELVEFDYWWNREVIMVTPSGQELFRKNFVLWAANKDGGAHVDGELPEAYEYLERCGSGWQVVKSENGFGAQHKGPESAPHEEPMPDAAMATMRQIAYEVLNSPDILVLARLDKEQVNAWFPVGGGSEASFINSEDDDTKTTLTIRDQESKEVVAQIKSAKELFFDVGVGRNKVSEVFEGTSVRIERAGNEVEIAVSSTTRSASYRCDTEVFKSWSGFSFRKESGSIVPVTFFDVETRKKLPLNVQCIDSYGQFLRVPTQDLARAIKDGVFSNNPYNWLISTTPPCRVIGHSCNETHHIFCIESLSNSAERDRIGRLALQYLQELE